MLGGQLGRGSKLHTTGSVCIKSGVNSPRMYHLCFISFPPECSDILATSPMVPVLLSPSLSQHTVYPTEIWGQVSDWTQH